MAVTPNYGWPVPVATDYVKDGWEAISDLGNAIDTTVAGLGSGLTKITTVTLTGSTGQALTGLTAGSRYKVILNAYASVSSAIVTFRFREGATAKTSSYFGASYYVGYTGTSGIYFTASNSSSFSIIRMDSGVDTQCIVSFDFVITDNQNTGLVTGSGTTDYDANQMFFGIRNNSMATCDGIELYPSTGTFTGKLTLYKYQD